MKELVDLIRTWRALPPGTPAVLATVVATSGSTYRRPGARMLLVPDGWAAGSISGGCLEGDLVESAFARTENGPALVTYDSTADEDILWGFGLGCNGIVQVLLERLPPDGGILAQIADAFDRRVPMRVATVIAPGPRLGERLDPLSLSKGEGRGEGSTLHETIHPPRPLLIFGAGHDAIPLVAAGKSLGWHVTVIDPRPSYADPARFSLADAVLATSPSEALRQIEIDPRTAVVVMAHHYLNDLATLREVLPTTAGYVGLLGPARRTQRLLADLRDEGRIFTDAQMSRIHAPIGLDIGAEGPDEIALAIAAEIQAHFTARPAGSLAGRTDPLHGFPQNRGVAEYTCRRDGVETDDNDSLSSTHGIVGCTRRRDGDGHDATEGQPCDVTP